MKFATPIFQLKRNAKLLARERQIPLNQALDQIARDQGFKNWSHFAFFEQQERSAAQLLKGLQPGDFVLLGARPRQGKTMLALQLLASAVQMGFSGVFYTLEYTDEEVWERFSGFGLTPTVSQSALRVDTSDDISADYIREHLKEAKAQSLVVIDYLQLLDQKRDKPDLQSQVDRLSRAAKETGSMIVALSQINREYDTSKSRVPGIDDVRLPNPIDLQHFTKTCFMQDGKIEISNNP